MCKYKDLFGKVGEGVHSYRLFNIAIVDVAVTLLLAYLAHVFFRMNFWIALLILFIMGIFLHRLFCVRTTVDKMITKLIEFFFKNKFYGGFYCSEKKWKTYF